MQIIVFALTILCLCAIQSAEAQANTTTCNNNKLNIDLALTQSEFFRGFENRDIVKDMLQLRKEARQDSLAGKLESCALKASILQQAIQDPLSARTIIKAYQQSVNKQAITEGFPVPFPTNGPFLSEQQVIGAPLMSFNNMRLGIITGVGYNSETGQPDFIIANVGSKHRAVQQVMVPTGMLLISKNQKVIFVNSTADEFWSRVENKQIALRN